MRILILATSLTLVACASQPPMQVSNEAATQTTDANAASDVAAGEPAPAAQVAATAAGSVVEPTAAFVPPPGYKRRPDMGENIYCQKMVVLGSRFPKEDCRTEQQLRDLMSQGGAMRGELDQRRGVCASNNGACGGS